MPKPIPIPDWMRWQFEAGEVPCDEPPGLTEHCYRQWKAAGGTVKAERLPGPPAPSLRDFFAAHALQGVLGSTHWTAQRGVTLDDTVRIATQVAYDLADAMLKAREGR